MAAITKTQLENASLDAQSFEEVVNGGPTTVVDTRLGASIDTVSKAINTLKAYNLRGAWLTATNYALKDVVAQGGIAYVAVLAHTSGTFATDLANGKWAIYQGVTQDILDDAIEGLGTSVNAYGALGDNSTDDTTAINNAIVAANGQRISGKSGKYKVGVDLTLTQGPQFDNNVQLVFPDGSLGNSYAYDELIFGQECLWGWHANIVAGVASNGRTSGDSTTAGTGVDPGYKIDALLQQMAEYDGFYGVTFTNAGHGGKTTQDWIEDYLGEDITATPKLYIPRWGINDPALEIPISQSIDNLNYALETYRETLTLEAGFAILLMTPNSVYAPAHDGIETVDEYWMEEWQKAVRQAAKAYKCGFIDTYALWQNARDGVGRWLDSSGLHPVNHQNMLIASKIHEFIFPEAMRKLSGGKTLTPTLLNGWQAFDGGGSSGNSLPGYSRKHGWVELQGSYKSGTTTDGTTYFNLPAGFRPPATVYFTTTTINNQAGFYITPGGDVKSLYGANATFTSMDGIRFKLA